MRMRMRIGRFVVLVLMCAGGGRVAAQENPLRVVADTDTLVPGSESSTFQNFFQLNGVSPDIDGRNVVFAACCPTGIYVYHGYSGQIEAIADLDSTFPGSGNPLGFDVADGSSPSISGSNVAFSCRNGRPGPGAICAYINGELESIAESAVTIAPGTNETFGTFFMLNGTSPDISGENVVFTASTQSRNGIYARINGQLRRIADNTTVVPDHPELTFMNFGQLSGISPSISGGNVAFFGFWSGGGGVYVYTDGQLRIVADSSTDSVSAASPSISGENVAYLGGGVYAQINGETRLIADRNTPAPESPGTFNPFFPLPPSISGENVAFFSAAEGFGAGIFAYIDGELELIANENSAVPGHEPTTFNTLGDGVSPAISGKDVVFAGNASVPFKHNVFGMYGRFIDLPIPAASHWSMIVLFAVLAVAGVVLLLRRRRIPPVEP